MGIYWFAVDFSIKELINPPKGCSIKLPGIFHPKNVFANMVMLQNAYGYNFELVNDMQFEENGFKDVTERAIKEYEDIFKDEISDHVDLGIERFKKEIKNEE